MFFLLVSFDFDSLNIPKVDPLFVGGVGVHRWAYGFFLVQQKTIQFKRRTHTAHRPFFPHTWWWKMFEVINYLIIRVKLMKSLIETRTMQKHSICKWATITRYKLHVPHMTKLTTPLDPIRPPMNPMFHFRFPKFLRKQPQCRVFLSHWGCRMETGRRATGRPGDIKMSAPNGAYPRMMI